MYHTTKNQIIDYKKNRNTTRIKKGWTKERNLISWNGRDPHYDINDWNLEHENMDKGVTLTEDELKKLKEVLCGFGD